MRIRGAMVTDAAAIASVHVASWRTTYIGLVPEHILANLSEERRRVQWEQTLGGSDEEICVFVAEDVDGEIVGFASGGPTRGEDPAYAGELYAVYLLQSAQGQGVGTLLVQAVARHLAEHNRASMIVWAIKGNPACQFYARLGGQFVREAPFLMGDAQIWEVAYGWKDTGPWADTLTTDQTDVL